MKKQQSKSQMKRVNILKGKTLEAKSKSQELLDRIWNDSEGFGKRGGKFYKSILKIIEGVDRESYCKGSDDCFESLKSNQKLNKKYPENYQK